MNKKIKLTLLSTLIVATPLATAVSCVNGKPNKEFVAKANEEQIKINEYIKLHDQEWVPISYESIKLIDKNQNFTTDNKEGYDRAQQIFDAIGYPINEWQDRVKENYTYLFFVNNFKSQTDDLLSSFEVNIRVIYNGTPNLADLKDEEGNDITVAPFTIKVERH